MSYLWSSATQTECRTESFSDHGNDSSSESDIMENEKQDEDHIDDPDDDKTNNLLANNNPQDEEEEITQNPVINNHNNKNTEAMNGKLELSQSILGVQNEGDKLPATTKKQQQMTQYLNEKLDGNRSSRTKSQQNKGRPELLEKSPVTPPDVLHDKQRDKGAKKAQKMVDR